MSGLPASARSPTCSAKVAALLVALVLVLPACAAPTPSQSATASPSANLSLLPSATPSESPSETPSESPTPSVSLSPSPTPPPQCVGKRVFRVELQYSWRPDFPPSLLEPELGFTPLICAAHVSNYSLWDVGQITSSAIQELVRFKNDSAILDSLRSLMDNGTVGDFSQSRGGEDVVESPGRDAVKLTVHADKNATYVSCIAVFRPSPDWFVGISKVQMCTPDNRFSEYYQDNLRAFDAELDDLEYFTGERQPSENAGPVRVRADLSEHLGYSLMTDVNSPRRVQRSYRKPSGPECFPAKASVLLENGSRVRVDQLQPSAVVRLLDGRSSPVFVFSHHDPHAKSTFVRAAYARNDNSTGRLTASKGHYVYVLHHGRRRLTPMSRLRAGAKLIASNGAPVTVTKIDSVVQLGLYNPHTLHGDLIVDDVLVSSFTRAVEPQIARSATCLLGALYRIGLGTLVHRLSMALLSGRYNSWLAQVMPPGA